MTVWIYVDTGKQVGDRDHLTVFASEMLLRHGSGKDPEGVAFEYEFWSEPHWTEHDHRDCPDLGSLARKLSSQLLEM